MNTGNSEGTLKRQRELPKQNTGSVLVVVRFTRIDETDWFISNLEVELELSQNFGGEDIETSG